MIEYALMAACVAVALIAGARAMGDGVKDTMETVGKHIHDAGGLNPPTKPGF